MKKLFKKLTAVFSKDNPINSYVTLSMFFKTLHCPVYYLVCFFYYYYYNAWNIVDTNIGNITEFYS